MKIYQPSALRNFAVIGHGDTGKTSLIASVLFNTGAVNRLGKVDDGTAPTDYDACEIERKISINPTVAYCEWKDCKLNIIDTPGYGDFIFHTREAMRVADSAVVTVCAVSGVEVFTEKVWEFADENNLARAIFINKLDRERGNFQRTLQQIIDTFDTNTRHCIPVQLPIGSEDSFKGIVDLISLKAYVYEGDQMGQFKKTQPPAEMEEEIQQYREKLIEIAAETDDSLIEKFLEGEALSDEEIINGLKIGIYEGNFIPVLCGSATKNIGTNQLLDFIVDFLPNPAEVGEAKGRAKIDDTEETLTRKASDAEPFSALVFQTLADPYTGRINVFRVYSGSIQSDTTVYNANKREKERIGPLFYLQGKEHNAAGTISAGDFGAVAKLKSSYTGDTLCNEANQILYSMPEPIPPLLSYAIQPKSKSDEEKINASITKLNEEDSLIHFTRNTETKEQILSGMGQLHIEVVKEKLQSRYNVECELKLPQVPYKETITGRANVQKRYKKQTGGRGQFAETWMKLEPLERGGGFEFVNEVVGGNIPRNFIPAVEKGIVDAMSKGKLAGFQIVDCKVILYDGKHHPVDSSDMAFQIAGSLAFKDAFMQSHPVLLEPIWNVDITIPEEDMGDIIGDLNSRRGRVLGMDPVGKYQIIKAQIPLAEILTYAPDLRSMTGGKGFFTMKFSHFEEVPAHLQEKVIAERKKFLEEEED